MYAFLKRTLDVAAAFSGLLLLSPLLAFLGLGALLSVGWPVLYGQVRPGHRARPFRLWKFRTMTEERDADGRLLPDDRRLTRFGRFLRSLSLDELPQLWNVLAGQMSLVGPRPLLTRYLPRYSERQAHRHDVKPGITGWAQVNGRNALDWETRLEYDVWYAEHASLALDLRILLRTVVSVLSRRGVKPGGTADFDEFWGVQGPPAAGPRSFPVEQDERTPESSAL